MDNFVKPIKDINKKGKKKVLKKKNNSNKKKQPKNTKEIKPKPIEYNENTENTTLEMPHGIFLPNYHNYSEKKIELIREYILSMDEIEICGLQVAIEDLETTLDIVKTIGFIKWLKNKK